MASQSLSAEESAETTMGRHQWLDMDPLSFSKVIQLQLEDIEQLSYRAKGKQREGTVTDAQFALQVYVDDLARSNATVSNRMAAENIATALLRDVPAIEEAYRREQQIAGDRELASKVAGGRVANANRLSMMQEIQRKEKDPLKELWPALIDSDSEESVVAAESSSWAAARLVRDTRSKRHCIACSEEKLIRELVVVPCYNRHEYCRSCLTRMVELAVEDECFFPPKCDGHVIPVDKYAHLLPRTLIDQFRAKALEYETKDRTYCYNSTCVAFIPPSSIDGLTGHCPKCRKTTCIICKLSGHLGECAGDEALRQLEETASTEKWQRCYMCNHVVQLENGCNHITCRCGTEFCYVCGAKWKTCRCEYWEEHRLYDPPATLTIDIPPELPPRPPVEPSTSTRRSRFSLDRIMWRPSVETTRNVSAPQTRSGARPRIRFDILSHNHEEPGVPAGSKQCAVQ